MSLETTNNLVATYFLKIKIPKLVSPSISEPIGSRNERMEGGMPRVPLPGAEGLGR